MEEDEGNFDSEETIDEDNENLDDIDPDDGPNFTDEDEELMDGDEEDGEDDRENDITSYRTTREIFESGQFSTEERRKEYRRRGKSPSGVIDGVYNDMYLDEGEIYNDSQRDWDADA